MEENQHRLTQFSQGAGCGCKIDATVLKSIIGETTHGNAWPNLLVGNHTNDDAAAMLMHNGKVILSTTDFFTPVVDDPEHYGRIAAANAMSDVYAMGGKPLMALAILGWPVDVLPTSMAARVLDGARAICTEAGIPLAGGHSVHTKEPLFGLSVTGETDEAHLKRNNTAQPGDIIYTTKPIGTGVLCTALKRGQLEEAYYHTLVQQMETLNSIGSSLAAISGVTSMTDITGFGLIGHLLEMMESASVFASVEYHQIPVMPGVLHSIGQKMIPDATYRNWNSYNAYIHFEPGVDVMQAFNLLPDPQTNGGLLFTCKPEATDEVEALFNKDLTQRLYPIGTVEASGNKRIRVLP